MIDARDRLAEMGIYISDRLYTEVSDGLVHELIREIRHYKSTPTLRHAHRLTRLISEYFNNAVDKPYYVRDMQIAKSYFTAHRFFLGCMLGASGSIPLISTAIGTTTTPHVVLAAITYLSALSFIIRDKYEIKTYINHVNNAAKQLSKQLPAIN